MLFQIGRRFARIPLIDHSKLVYRSAIAASSIPNPPAMLFAAHLCLRSLAGSAIARETDDKLLKDAKAACGAMTDTETLRLGLEALVRHAAYERLRAFRGSEPHAQDVPRRRERRPAKRKVA